MSDLLLGAAAYALAGVLTFVILVRRGLIVEALAGAALRDLMWGWPVFVLIIALDEWEDLGPILRRPAALLYQLARPQPPER